MGQRAGQVRGAEGGSRTHLALLARTRRRRRLLCRHHDALLLLLAVVLVLVDLAPARRRRKVLPPAADAHSALPARRRLERVGDVDARVLEPGRVGRGGRDGRRSRVGVADDVLLAARERARVPLAGGRWCGLVVALLEDGEWRGGARRATVARGRGRGGCGAVGGRRRRGGRAADLDLDRGGAAGARHGGGTSAGRMYGWRTAQNGGLAGTRRRGRGEADTNGRRVRRWARDGRVGRGRATGGYRVLL